MVASEEYSRQEVRFPPRNDGLPMRHFGVLISNRCRTKRTDLGVRFYRDYYRLCNLFDPRDRS